MFLQTLKIIGVGTVLAPFTSASIALCTTMFRDINDLSSSEPWKNTSMLLEKFGNFSKNVSKFFFAGSKDILYESGHMVTTVVDESAYRLKNFSEFFFAGSKDILYESGHMVTTVVDESAYRLKITAYEIGYQADITTNVLGGKAQAVLFDGLGAIANGVKSFVGLGEPAPEVNLDDAQPAFSASSPTTTVETAQAATPVGSYSTPADKQPVHVKAPVSSQPELLPAEESTTVETAQAATPVGSYSTPADKQPVLVKAPVSSQLALLPAEASAKLSTLIIGNPVFKKAVDSSGDIKLTLSDSEQKHIISLADKISNASGAKFTDKIPSLVSLNFCEVTSTATIAQFSAIQKYAQYIDKGGDLEKAEMKLTHKVTESETAGYIIWEKVFKIIPAEKSILCSLYEQVKTTAEYQNIFTTEVAKEGYCHDEPSSVLCTDMFSDLFVASHS